MGLLIKLVFEKALAPLAWLERLKHSKFLALSKFASRWPNMPKAVYASDDWHMESPYNGASTAERSHPYSRQAPPLNGKLHNRWGAPISVPSVSAAASSAASKGASKTCSGRSAPPVSVFSVALAATTAAANGTSMTCSDSSVPVEVLHAPKWKSAANGGRKYVLFKAAYDGPQSPAKCTLELEKLMQGGAAPLCDNDDDDSDDDGGRGRRGRRRIRRGVLGGSDGAEGGASHWF